jgi:diaminohydroxyphosphoribosylaminopyrimidine deaminase/5-amino-6-(5-phosphoribosylamino)uracil reductase
MNHADFMNTAFRMACARMGITSPNPPVGAIVVKDGSVVSIGGTQVCGGDHAEICALSSAGERAQGADLYVTLEPCCHHGKTPPCTDAIIRAGIARVFIPVIDPDPRISGGGIAALRSAGIEVTIMDELERTACQILRPFFTRIEKKRPHVIIKTAMTADGRTATETGDSKWISSSLSRLFAHRLRAVSDAIVIGRATFEHDNPALTCRIDSFREEAEYLKREGAVVSGSGNYVLEYLLSGEFDHLPRDPFRVLMGMPANMRGDEAFFSDENYCVFARASRIDMKLPMLKTMSDRERLVVVDDDESMVDRVMSALYDKGFCGVLVEGGESTTGAFFRRGYIDEYLAVIAPKLLGGGRGIMARGGVEKIADALPLTDVSFAGLGGDIIVHGYRG